MSEFSGTFFVYNISATPSVLLMRLDNACRKLAVFAFKPVGRAKAEV